VLDRDTVIRSPHAATATRHDATTEWQVDDPRVSVEMQEEGATVTLFFDPARAFAGDAPVLEVRLTPTLAGKFEPWRLLPTLPLHLQYARASLAFDHNGAGAALRALRQINSTGRGLSDDFLRLVAQLYESLVTEGETYPVKALAAMQHVDKSTASRWISAARDRGYIPTDTEDDPS
jgi:hypothetical protein